MIKLKKIVSILNIFLLFSSLLTGCSSQNSTKEISIGSKNFTESFLTAEMYALTLEEAGFKVNRKFNLGTTAIAQQALQNNDIDLYPEYTGTALMDVFKNQPLYDADKVYESIKKQYKEKYKLDILTQSPLNNTQAIAVSKEIAEKYNLKTLSDLASNGKNIVLGCPPEFKQRQDGVAGLKKVYGNFHFKDVKSYDIGLRYVALTNKEIDATVAFTTDGQIKAYNLVVLEDDKHLWPPYHIVPVIRETVLKENSEIEQALNKVNALLTNQAMQELNWKVDGDKKEYADVAKEFLINNKIIEK